MRCELHEPCCCAHFVSEGDFVWCSRIGLNGSRCRGGYTIGRGSHAGREYVWQAWVLVVLRCISVCVVLGVMGTTGGGGGGLC